MTHTKNIDALLDPRSDRSVPLNVETVLVESFRKRKLFNPEDENEELKSDGSDLDTIRGDLEPTESIPPEKRNSSG